MRKTLQCFLLATFTIFLYFKQNQVVSPPLSCHRPPAHFPLLLFLSISSFPSLHFPACLQSKKNTRHMLAGRDMLEWPEYVCTHAGIRLQGGHGLLHHLKSWNTLWATPFKSFRFLFPKAFWVKQWLMLSRSPIPSTRVHDLFFCAFLQWGENVVRQLIFFFF